MSDSNELSNSHSAQLLLVDDDPIITEVMSRILRDYPNQRFAPSAVEARNQICELKPDLVLLDVEMPEIGGLELARFMKADPHFADIPIIFVTGHETVPVAVAVFKSGGVDFITKSMISTRLLDCVREQLRAARG
jgi:putative two-component system response regulator